MIAADVNDGEVVEVTVVVSAFVTEGPVATVVDLVEIGTVDVVFAAEL